MNNQEAIGKVNESLGSLFTKQDVVNVINMIGEDAVEERYTLEQVRSVVRDLVERITCAVKGMDTSDIVDIDDVELCLEGNRIEISSVDVQVGQIVSIITDEFDEFDVLACIDKNV